MGQGAWKSDQYTQDTQARRAANIPDFDHDQKVRTGQASGIHKALDPKTVAGPTSPLMGQNVRESRDSDEHPESLPIAVFFDVTGSMGWIPVALQQKLVSLMDVVLAKTGLKDPQVLVGAIGDATCDQYPFQVGQFESDNRFDEALRSMILEGGGGGQTHESYGLAFRFAADHTATDSFEKRGKKGYLFTMGDEMPWPVVSAKEVRNIFGIGCEDDESVKDLVARASEKWEIYHICLTGGTSHGSDPKVHKAWRDLLGERLVMLDDADLVCETIAGIIHMLEGAHDLMKVADDLALTGNARTSVSNALAPIAKTLLPVHVATGDLPDGLGGTSGVSPV